MIRLSLLLSALALVTGVCSAEVSEKTNQSFPANSNVVIAVSNVNGSIDIRAWDRPEVSLVAEKKAPTKEGLDEIKIKVDAAPDHLSIKTLYPHHPIDRDQGMVHYMLRVPAGASVEKIENVNCSINVVGVKGYIEISSVNGAINLKDTSSSLSVSTVNGSVRISAENLPHGSNLHIRSVNGSTRLDLPSQVSARFDISSLVGGVHSAFPLDSSGFIGRSYHGTAGSGDASVKIETVNGSVSIEKH